VGKRKPRRLLAHRAPDFRHAVSDAHDRSLSRRIEIFAAIRGKQPATFAPQSDGKFFAKMARKNGGVV
jgi:hypothetical protein